MATLVFSALGTAFGGPLGGALGSLVGNQFDRAVGGSSARRGGRIKELAVTTSSYGTAIPRHYGTMRAAGSIIWATDLIESSETSGQAKGQPASATYSYSISFAVALASRPIARLGRIWADGNLLRGATGDLKTGGALRIYTGRGDQEADPVIAAQRGPQCPAFRDFAYCVFEGLQLSDFGNRIPALTFEVVADDGEVSLAKLLAPLAEDIDAERPLDRLLGFSDEGGSLIDTLATIDEVYPLALDAGGDRLTLRAADDLPSVAPLLSEPAVVLTDEGMGGPTGASQRRQPDLGSIPEGLRYYDVARDFQTGMQRPVGRARQISGRILDFPGALEPAVARALADEAAERGRWARETITWRTAELDPSIAPGSVVRVPGQTGQWRVGTWEWRQFGVEMELVRLPRCRARTSAADAGEALPALDLIATPTILRAFELPDEGIGSSSIGRVFAAATSISAGWKGAALYLDDRGDLVPLGSTGRRRSILGSTVTDLGGSPALLLERSAVLEVQLVSDDFELGQASPERLANGANRALVGQEILQFAQARRIDGSRWRLTGLLRGRGGTEPDALAGHPAGADFVLLDETLIAIETGRIGLSGEVTIAAIGLADPNPAMASIAARGIGVRPLTPVHPRQTVTEVGMLLEWTRRARGAWLWVDEVDAAADEPKESYIVGFGEIAQPVVHWHLDTAKLEISHAVLSAHAGHPLWVRQVGQHAVSDPLHLATLS